MSLISTAYAMGVPSSGGAGEPNLLSGLMPFILIFVVFYFLLIRPQQKKAKQHREMLNALKKGDSVITAGGLYGRIVETRDDALVLDLGEGTLVTVGRGYISGVPGRPQPAPASESKKGKKGKSAKAAPATEAPAETPAGESKDAAAETPDAQADAKSDAGSESVVSGDDTAKDNDSVVK